MLGFLASEVLYFYFAIYNFLANKVFGTYPQRSSFELRVYDSGGTVVQKQYWTEYPIKPKANAKYVLIEGSGNLPSILESGFKIKVKKNGLTMWEDIILKDGVRIDLAYQQYQLTAHYSNSTIYMYELNSEMDIDSVRIEQIPLATTLQAYHIYFASEEEVESLGTFIKNSPNTNYWFDYYAQELDANINLAEDSYLHTDTHLLRFANDDNKLIKINKATGAAEEITGYDNYCGIKAFLKPLSTDPNKIIFSELPVGQSVYALKTYDIGTDSIETLMLPTISNLDASASVGCYIDDANEKVYFRKYEDATNKLMEMNFTDETSIQLTNESFVYIKAIEPTTLSLVLNKNDGSSLNMSYTLNLDQTLYLVLKNGGEISVQSGKIYALWGEK